MTTLTVLQPKGLILGCSPAKRRTNFIEKLQHNCTIDACGAQLRLHSLCCYRDHRDTRICTERPGRALQVRQPHVADGSKGLKDRFNSQRQDVRDGAVTLGPDIGDIDDCIHPAELAAWHREKLVSRRVTAAEPAVVATEGAVAA